MSLRNLPVSTIGLTLATLLAIVPVVARPAQAPQQESVVEAARKAREQQKTQPKATKVYTNEDLANLKGVVSVVGQTPTANPVAGATATPAKAAAPPAAPPAATDEAGWRAKFAEARRTLADDAKELDILQREFNLKQQQYYSDPNVALREQNSRKDLDDSQANIAAKQQDVDRDKQAISELENALRKAGGDPGWATEPPPNNNPSGPPA